MTLKRKITLILLVSLLGVIFAASAVVTYAYFSKKEIYDGYLSGQVELLFDRLNDKGVAAYDPVLKAEFGDTVAANKNADWGSKEYPFVISNVRHLYNLSELQRLGYFDKKFISQNAAGEYSKIPYFLVCTPDYTPALIDGTNFRGITAIGTDKYPFIGSVKGVQNTDTTVSIDVNGKKCDTSSITNVKVTGNPQNADVGLFGVIGFLGTVPEITTENPNPTFEGQISTVSNLVISDIQVTVDSSAWDAVTAFLEDIMINATNGHEFSFSELHGTADYDKVPHENHHIGILAGHASYAKIEYVSVYYSSDDVVAINLKDTTDVGGTKANYFSSTGILGYINNINPEVTINQATGKVTITAGSGDSTSELSYGSVGGGGALSGDKAGYVLAGEMYKKFCYTGAAGNLTQDTDGTIFIKDALDKDGNALCTEWVRDRILWGTQRTGRYYFYDGVFTFALSDQQDIIEPTWNIVKDESGNPVMVDGNYSYDIPDFTIGQNDDTKWQANTSKGNKAVVAYVKKVTNDEALQTAINNGDQIFVMQEGAESLFLMSLYEQSTAGSGNFNEKYTTPGTTQKFASDQLVNALADAYISGEIAQLPADITNEYKDVNKLANALKSGELKAINVGITSSGVSLDDLKLKYKINPAVTGNHKYFVGDTPVSVNADGTIQQYYDYAKSGYAGYFYYTTETRSTPIIPIPYEVYTYYWQPLQQGVEASIVISETRNGPSDYFNNNTISTEKWANENVYTYNGKTGVLVNKTDGNFYSTNSTANANGATLTKPATGDALYYFYNDVRTDDESKKVYTHSTGGGTYTLGQLTDTGNKSTSDQPIYQSSDGKNGVLLDRYPTYTFSNGDKYLRMVEATFQRLISYGTHYALWNGSNTAANTATNFNHSFGGTITPTVSNSTEATLRFAPDGTCYIQYSIGSTGLYVNSTGSAFNTAASNASAGTKLCIYTVEGTQGIAYGRITYDPIDDPASDTDSYSFSAGEYVLKAEVDPQTQATDYVVTSLEELSWNNGFGQTLSRTDLLSKFKMIKGITFGASFNLLNGTLGSSGIITAPVGTDGVEANIPQACIAFKINKPNIQAKIRVILSVAVSEYYPGEKQGETLKYDLGDYTRYFNLWKMEAAGESIIQIFNANSYLERFEVLRSHPYEPTTSAADAQHITVKYNNADYRCYLNGDRILIAHEFVVDTSASADGTGVYCLGMSGIDANGDTVENVPMEIVYFSADGVASSGRDGASGSQIGTIDFVYDYNNTIVTVKDSSSTDENRNEDYNTYYPSYCLLYFNNSQELAGSTADNPTFVSINNEVLKVRRYVDMTADSDTNHNDTPSLSTMTFSLEGDKYVLIVQYSRVADNVREKDVPLS